jgi:hypothetical protein
MSIILTIYVTLAHFIKTNVNHSNYIWNIIKTNVNHHHIVRMIDISFYNDTYIVRMIDIKGYTVTYIVRMIDISFYDVTYIVRMIHLSLTLVHLYKLISFILTIYVTLAHFIKTNVNHTNYICNISPFYKN